MSERTCIICLNKTDEQVTDICCCTKPVHQTCLDHWFNQPISLGRCPHCRQRSGKPINDTPLVMDWLSPDEEGASDILYRWQNPDGIINVMSGDGSINITTTLKAGSAEPTFRICPYHEFETEILDDNEDIIILTNEDGEYFDTLNIPAQWLLSVNHVPRSLQLSAYLRLEP